MLDCGTFVIMGGPFSGTTLLSTLLGGHSTIGNVGEFMCYYCWNDKLRPAHPYFNRATLSTFDPNRALCAECHRKGEGSTCPVWGSRPVFSHVDLWKQVRKHVKKPYLVDSTKVPAWYTEVLSAMTVDKQGDLNDPVIFILLHKPVWGYLASVAGYHNLASTSDLDDTKVANIASGWANYYTAFKDLVDRYPCATVIDVRYEDLVMDTRGTLQRILAPRGLVFEEGQLALRNINTQHQISGNAKLHCERAGGPIKIRPDMRIGQVPFSVRRKALDRPLVTEAMTWLGRIEETQF